MDEPISTIDIQSDAITRVRQPVVQELVAQAFDYDRRGSKRWRDVTRVTCRFAAPPRLAC
jgi:hypothetical protein